MVVPVLSWDEARAAQASETSDWTFWLLYSGDFGWSLQGIDSSGSVGGSLSGLPPTVVRSPAGPLVAADIVDGPGAQIIAPGLI